MQAKALCPERREISGLEGFMPTMVTDAPAPKVLLANTDDSANFILEYMERRRGDATNLTKRKRLIQPTVDPKIFASRKIVFRQAKKPAG